MSPHMWFLVGTVVALTGAVTMAVSLIFEPHAGPRRRHCWRTAVAETLREFGSLIGWAGVVAMGWSVIA